VKETTQSNSGFDILIVGDQPDVRQELANGLSGEVDCLETVADMSQALAKFEGQNFQLAIVDVSSGCDLSQFKLLAEILDASPADAVILVTADRQQELRVQAMRAEALAFLRKPVNIDLVRKQVRKAREYYRLRIENQELRLRLAGSAAMQRLFAESPGDLRQLRTLIDCMVVACNSDVIDEQLRPEVNVYGVQNMDDSPRQLGATRQVTVSVPVTLAEAVQSCERVTIQMALESCGRHRERTAKALGISVRTLHYKMLRHGLY
jgi:DNA-binding NtrC family response regulator